jgi:phosphoglycolate phosphatase
MKLILFDIDGTLIGLAGVRKYEIKKDSETKFSYAIRKVFNINHLADVTKYKGYIDRNILWDIVEPLGVLRADFEEKFSKLSEAMHEYMVTTATDTSLYQAIPSAKQFVDLVFQEKDTIACGLLTGNVESIAHWKMEKAGFDDMFRFGLYGEEADDRVSLAKKVFVKARAFFHTEFHPHDIVVIGDTTHDVRCGKAIGAITISVTIGSHATIAELEKEQPDFLVETLMDKSVLDYFGVKQV